MTDKRRKRIWKRVRFWGGMVLLVVVGIGLLCWHTYRKSLGPPPTPPGKSSEFDQHLAEINDKWLFMLWEMKRLVICDIYGNEKKVLVDVGDIDHPFIEHSSPIWVFSPEGNWLLLSYELWDDKRWGQSESLKKIILIRTRDFAVFPILVPDPDLTDWYIGDWLSDTTFVTKGTGEFKAVPVTKRTLSFGGFGSDDSSGSGLIGTREFKWYRYSVDDPENPKEIDLPEWLWDSKTGKTFLYDDDSGLMLFATMNMEIESGEGDDLPLLSSLDCRGQVMAHDKDGQRQATPEEEERFMEWAKAQNEDGRSRSMSAGHVFYPNAYGIPVPADAPFVEVEEVTRHPLPLRILKWFGIQPAVRYEFRIKGRTIRCSKTGIIWYGVTPSLWEDGLRLLYWGEFLYVGEPADVYEFLSLNSYYADEEGHYRFWHLGRYLEKFPRVKENKGTEE